MEGLRENRPRALDTKVFARLFTADKGADLLRTILDCRAVNEVVGRPPPLRLASLREIADVLRHFPSPFCITLIMNPQKQSKAY